MPPYAILPPPPPDTRCHFRAMPFDAADARRYSDTLPLMLFGTACGLAEPLRRRRVLRCCRLLPARHYYFRFFAFFVSSFLFLRFTPPILSRATLMITLMPRYAISPPPFRHDSADTP
jgi:hypothetical protein